MTSLKPATGFLVVLEQSEDSPGGLYKGLGRIPAHYFEDSVPEGRLAMDQYVFGDFKDDESDLIPSLDKAMELLALFSKSPRAFEIIYCRPLRWNSKRSVEHDPNCLGFDVVNCPGDFWSIVDDLPDSPELSNHFAALNQGGLFDTARDAHAYLRAYRRHKLDDYDFPLRVFDVDAVPVAG